MAKKSEYNRSGENLAILPELLCMIGLDTTHKVEDKHPDFDVRVFNKVTAEKVALMRLVGAQVQAVQVNMVDVEEVKKFLKPSWVAKAKAAWRLTDATAESELPTRIAVVSRGRQRTLAARALNEQNERDGAPRFYLPVRAAAMVDARTEFTLRIAENCGRTDMTPLEKAREMKISQANYGTPLEQLGLTFNVHPKQRVEWHLELLDLVEDVQNAIDAGKVSASRAHPWHKFSGEDQRKFLRECLNPTAGAQGEAPTQGGEGGDENGEGGGTPLPSGAPAMSTPKGFAVPRSTLKRLYDEVREDRVKLQKQYADAIGWACGELRGPAIPAPIVSALAAIAAIDNAAEEAATAAKNAKEAKKAETAAKRASGEAVKGPKPKPPQPDNKPSVSMASIAAEVLGKNAPPPANDELKVEESVDF